MILTCVGGQNDGTTFNTGTETLQPSYLLTVAKKLSFLDLSYPKDIVIMEHERYILESISFRGNENVFFLRFAELTSIEAFLLLLKNHSKRNESN